jgi:hypothetical protein
VQPIENRISPSAQAPVDPRQRAGEVAEIAADLRTMMDRLDAAGLHLAAARLALSVDAVDAELAAAQAIATASKPVRTDT